MKDMVHVLAFVMEISYEKDILLTNVTLQRPPKVTEVILSAQVILTCKHMSFQTCKDLPWFFSYPCTGAQAHKLLVLGFLWLTKLLQSRKQSQTTWNDVHPGMRQCREVILDAQTCKYWWQQQMPARHIYSSQVRIATWVSAPQVWTWNTVKQNKWKLHQKWVKWFFNPRCSTGFELELPPVPPTRSLLQKAWKNAEK